MSFSWQITPEAAWPPFVQAQVDAFEADLVAFAESMTGEITAWMQANHRWENRTGDAERGLFSALLRETHQMVGILMSHGSLIEYAVYLEWSHAGRWGVLADTVDNFAPVFFNGVRDIVRRRFGG